MLKLDKKRLLHGTLLKCVDGRWRDNDGLEPPEHLLAIGTVRALQRWYEQKPIDTIIETADEPLPDHEELNAQIPQSEWETGLDGNPRPPWQLNFAVYLLDGATAEMYTFVNSTTGARIAFERLNDKLDTMRFLRGENVVPLVALDGRPMKTAFGTKMRPEFTVVDWTDLAPQIASGPSPRMIEHNGGVKPAAPDETSDAPSAPAAKPAAAAKFSTGKASTGMPGKPMNESVGKPVEPVSMAEEMKDDVPF
jgi:hypothetical protein